MVVASVRPTERTERMKIPTPIVAVTASAAMGAAVAVGAVELTSSSAPAATATVVRTVERSTGTPAASTSGAKSVQQIYRDSVDGVVEIRATSTSTSSNDFFG